MEQKPWARHPRSRAAAPRVSRSPGTAGPAGARGAGVGPTTGAEPTAEHHRTHRREYRQPITAMVDRNRGTDPSATMCVRWSLRGCERMEKVQGANAWRVRRESDVIGTRRHDGIHAASRDSSHARMRASRRAPASPSVPRLPRIYSNARDLLQGTNTGTNYRDVLQAQVELPTSSM